MTVTPIPRDRSRDYRTEQIAQRECLFTDTQYVQTAQSTEMVGRSESMSDYIIPGFDKLRAKGGLFFNGCTKEVINYSVQPAAGSIDGSQTPDKRIWSGAWNGWEHLGGGFLSIPTFTNEMAVTANNAFAQVSSAEMLSLVTFAELKETKEMFLNVLRRVGKMRVDLERWKRLVKASRSRAAEKAAKDAADLWLEIRYGWTPLYHEARAVAKIVGATEERVSRQTFRAFEAINDQKEETYLHDLEPERFNWTKSMELKGSVSSGVMAIPRVGGRQDVLGITKLPETIWDLTRLSFALDWLFNIGSTIAAWTPDTYWQTAGSWTTIKFVAKRRCSCAYSRTDDWKVSMSPYVREEEREYYFRTGGAERSIIPLPAFRMNWKHYIDAVALSRKRIMDTIGKCYRANPKRRHYHAAK